MPKFTFIGEHTDLYGRPNGTKVTYEFHVDSLDDVLEHTELFIRGCGYMPTGTLDYIQDDFPDWVGQDENITPVESDHSQHYFDTERNK